MTHFSPDQAAFISGLRKAALKEMGLESSADILVRLTRYVEDVSSEILGEKKLSDLQDAGLKRAIADTPRSVGAIHDLIISQHLSVEQREDLLFAFAKLIDDALEIGFYHALDRTSLRRSDRIIQGASDGGKKGSLSRRAKADAWKALVDDQIVRIRKDKPGLSQDRLAEEIIFALGEDAVPGHQSITKHISTFDKMARLAVRNEGGSHT